MGKNLFKLLKIICMLLCVMFLVTACGSEGDNGEGGTAMGGSHDKAEDLQREQRKCWQGSLLGTFYDNLGAMSIKVYKNLTGENLLGLLMLAFSIWMAFQILRHVSATSPESIGEFWTKVIQKAALCLICGTLASSTENIMYALNTFVFPIYITLLEFCDSILKITSAPPQDLCLPDKSGGAGICIPMDNAPSGNCTIDLSKVSMSADKFPEAPGELMKCMACSVGARLDAGYQIAITTLGKAGLASFLVAVFLIASFTIAKFGFALYLVDSIFRLDMMIVIAPFLILFYPFEQTRKWTGVGFKIILNSAAIMLCLAILVSMTIVAMQNVLTSPSMGIEFGDPDAYSGFGIVPITMVFLGIVVFKATGLAVTLSDSVTGGGGDTKFQKKMAALVGTIAKGIFVIATWGSGKAVTAAIDHVERVKAIYDKIQKAKAKINKAKNAMNRIAGR
ncbi:MAG: hypothetical protein J6N49_07170 [Alphaproteobacteria bacterium]|nr:hypothetical protein [Alphaproteobacteria bacterium]